jgi:hypothetical protein
MQANEDMRCETCATLPQRVAVAASHCACIQKLRSSNTAWLLAILTDAFRGFSLSLKVKSKVAQR